MVQVPSIKFVAARRVSAMWMCGQLRDERGLVRRDLFRDVVKGTGGGGCDTT
jgi:hypothetical protein